MANKNNNFLESLKVSDTKQINATREAAYSDRDVYTCLKLMGDTAKIQDFLLSTREQEVDDKKISTDMSRNYFYNISDKLSHAEFGFRKGNIKYVTFYLLYALFFYCFMVKYGQNINV